MFEQSRRLDHRILGANWVEVISYPDGQSLAAGHLKDISTGGLSFDLPVRLGLDSRVRVRLSGMSSSGLVRHFQFTGKIVHAEPLGFGCTHGVKFADMTTVEQSGLLDYLCQVDIHHRPVS